MTQDDREAFSESQIAMVFEAQDGLCKKCGASLEQTGIHAHHESSKHDDNSLTNLSLLCPKCHFTTFKGSNPWDEHKATEKKIFKSLMTVIENTLDPASKMSGATLEKLNDAMTLALKVSRNVNEIDYGRMQVPGELRIRRKLIENDLVADTYMEAYMSGVRDTLSRVEVKKNE